MDHSFCRILYNMTMKEVRQLFTAETIKSAWAYNSHGTMEFHINECKEIPEGFYYVVKGDCLWTAKANGWNMVMQKYKPAEYEAFSNQIEIN